jgi:branched-chain amino acid transport system substrate-binding protein
MKSVLRSAALTAGLVALATAGQAQDGTIKVGVVQPQAGECAQWGVPITRGVELWAAEFNAAGGIEDANGDRHLIEVKGYDNACYTAGEELAAFRQAILDDGVEFILQTFTPASRKAVAQIATENEVLVTSYGAGFLSPEFPYLIGSVTGSPASYMFLVSEILESYPEVERVAIVTADQSFGEAARAFYRAGIAPYSDRVEIVYDDPYDPAMAGDMFGLASPVAAAQPDLIVELGFTPGQQAIFVETMQQLGYDGLYGSEGWTTSFIAERVDPASVAGKLFSAYVVDASETTFSDRVTGFYKAYVQEFGEAEWSVFASVAYAAMTTIEAGIRAADEPTGAAVREALFAQDTVDQPLFGVSAWGGADIYGADNHLLTPLPVYTTTEDGAVSLHGVVDVAAWWEANKDAALPELEAGGQITAE